MEQNLSQSSSAGGLTVGQVSTRSGVRVSTVHFYESKGLIGSWRTASGHRRFSREVLRRIAVIRVALRAGVPLSKIRDAFRSLPIDRAPTREDWMRLSTRWRADLEERIQSLTNLRDQLDGCIGCGCLSTSHCPLRNPDDSLASQGPGPRLLYPTGKP